MAFWIDPESDRFLVIGSDGLWDVMSSHDVSAFLFELNERKGKSDLDFAYSLVNEARERYDAFQLSKEYHDKKEDM